jgi:hypothetical protein
LTWLSGWRRCEHIRLQAALVLVGERLHELAQHFRRLPVFSQTGPLERLAEFPSNTDTKANVFARHNGGLLHGYTFVYPKS